jgi:ADP-heptose:LPS heptosyltransferase
LSIPQRILIIRPSSLGDVIRTVPALVSLRRAFPKAKIDWLVNDAFAPAIANHPDLSNIIHFPRAALGGAFLRGDLARAIAWARATLREPGYDLVIDYQGLLRSGLLTGATDAPRRVGFADAREMGWLGYNERVTVERGRRAHHVDRVLALTKAAGAEPVADLRLYPDPKDREAIANDPALRGRYVLLAPTTRGLGRAWPIDRYAALAKHLVARCRELHIDAVVVTGLASERDYCRPLLGGTAVPAVSGAGVQDPAGTAGPPIVDRIGHTTISSLMALIERAALVVCNDSAAMHMAVAFSRPMVALLGPSDLGHAGPYKREADVIQHKHPDEHVRHRDVPKASELMRRITVEEVVAACEARLQG